MAFNFNWAPLSGDPDFYKRAEELLTNAMNKNQKPPIIVDDIIVTELNLGDVPPDLEVVEISDIGIDKFRGTFKMSYTGNAFITIKTRVQANPLNTYLGTRPSYTSPAPLAAAAGLTIPLQITLSDFKLSAIIILVFSRQKGLTIVFRNDPLESLKVSSTFDSIQFVANYLQQVIEGQLRTLFMDELPAIIHRMSLRLWVPEQKAREERALREDETPSDEHVIDPLASPPQDPVDSSGTVLTPAEVATLSLHSHVETQTLFSQKNLLRLAALTDSHRTLSLFTPNIRDAVFRAWTGPLERGEMTSIYSKAPTPALSRTQSYTGSISSTHSFDGGAQIRPPLHSHSSSFTGRLKSHPTRKRKKRVVNLRKQSETGEMETVIEDGSTITDSASVTESTSDAPTVFSAPPGTASSGVHVSAELVTPPTSPRSLRRAGKEHDVPSQDDTLEMTPMATRVRERASKPLVDDRPTQDLPSPTSEHHRTRRVRQRRVVDLTTSETDQTPRGSMFLPEQQRSSTSHRSENESASVPQSPLEKSPFTEAGPSSSSAAAAAITQAPLPNFLSFITDPSNSSSIAERAWMMKMAGELARRYEEERTKGSFDIPSYSGGHNEQPPPAYNG